MTSTDGLRNAALRAHLHVVFRTMYRRVSDSYSAGRQPLEIPQEDLLLLSASMRALLTDKAVQRPLLLHHLDEFDIDAQVRCVETDFSMLFLNAMDRDQAGSSSNLFLAMLIGTKETEGLDDGKEHEVVIVQKGQIPPSLARTPELWAPKKDSQHGAVGPANDGQDVQLAHISARTCSVREWLSVRLGYLKDIPIRRDKIIEYAANHLGGVHFDEDHHTAIEDKEFRLLSQIFTWEQKPYMHGVLVALAVCAIELVQSQQIQEIYQGLMANR